MDKIEKFGEDIEIENDGSENEETSLRIDKYDITSYPADYTTSTLLSKYLTSIIVPEFQRRYVWENDTIRQSRLIESFLLGLPIPQIFLFQRKNDKNLLIIDGYQRVHTIYRFVNNELELQGVQDEWKGKKYSNLSSEEKEVFDNSTIRAIIIRQISPEDKMTSMYHIFERLNTGGMVLSPMEIRKAIFYGDFFKTLEKLNHNSNWQKIISKKTVDKRLRDIEWILRIFAIYQCEIENYFEPMKDFLTEFIHKNCKNNFYDLANKFENICEIVVKTLGIKPFHIPKGRLNLAVLDSVIVTLLKKETVMDLKTKFKTLSKSEKFLEIIQSRNATRKNTLIERLEIVNNIFGE